MSILHGQVMVLYSRFSCIEEIALLPEVWERLALQTRGADEFDRYPRYGRD